jgi:hypothetical protein
VRSFAVVWMTMAVLAASGCQGTVDAPPTCPVVDGVFKANSTLRDSVGTCEQAKAHSYDQFTFKKGRFVSPLEGVVACTTVQADCSVTVKCKAAVVKATADFDGTLAEDGSGLTGLATFLGRYQGCDSISYDVDATR